MKPLCENSKDHLNLFVWNSKTGYLPLQIIYSGSEYRMEDQGRIITLKEHLQRTLRMSRKKKRGEEEEEKNEL